MSTKKKLAPSRIKSKLAESMVFPGRFRTGAGRLTPYALACGYLEQRQCELRTGDLTEKVEITLWQESPGVRSYHVRANALTPDGKAVDRRLFWLTYPLINDARKCFDRHPATTLKQLYRDKGVQAI